MLNNENAPAQVRGLDEGKEQENTLCLGTSNAPVGQQKGAIKSTQFSLTVISAEIPGRLSKSFSKDSEGNTVKKPGGQLVEGVAQHLPIQSMAQFAKLLPILKTHQALCYGVPIGLPLKKQVRVVTKDNVGEGEIARSRVYFDWPAGPGILMVDYDPRPGAEPLTREALRQALIDVCPALANTPMVMADSASSWIFDGGSENAKTCLIGQRGLRAYTLVADARDIPRAGKVLFDRLVLDGHGYCVVSKNGHILVRTLIDQSVFQPERLDFAAGAHCVAPLVQNRPEPEVFNNDAKPLVTLEVM